MQGRGILKKNTFADLLFGKMAYRFDNKNLSQQFIGFYFV